VPKVSARTVLALVKLFEFLSAICVLDRDPRSLVVPEPLDQHFLVTVDYPLVEDCLHLELLQEKWR
jgi:hypothetical protein